MKRTGAAQEHVADSGGDSLWEDALKVWLVLLTPTQGLFSGSLESGVVPTRVEQKT